jgi:hypothetical protein
MKQAIEGDGCSLLLRLDAIRAQQFASVTVVSADDDHLLLQHGFGDGADDDLHRRMTAAFFGFVKRCANEILTAELLVASRSATDPQPPAAERIELASVRSSRQEAATDASFSVGAETNVIQEEEADYDDWTMIVC